MTNDVSFDEFDFLESMKKSRKGIFLTKMETIVPWAEINAIAEPCYDAERKKTGQCSYPLDTMLRIYLLQQWYNLSASDVENALCDSMAMRYFSRLGDFDNPTPDEAEIFAFRQLLEKENVSDKILDAVLSRTKDAGVRVSAGKISDPVCQSRPVSAKTKPKNDH